MITQGKMKLNKVQVELSVMFFNNKKRQGLVYVLFYVNFSELYEGGEPDLTDHGDTSPGNECLCHISVSLCCSRGWGAIFVDCDFFVHPWGCIISWICRLLFQ